MLLTPVPEWPPGRIGWGITILGQTATLPFFGIHDERRQPEKGVLAMRPLDLPSHGVHRSFAGLDVARLDGMLRRTCSRRGTQGVLKEDDPFRTLDARVPHPTVYDALPLEDELPRVHRTDAVPAPDELVPMTSRQDTEPERSAVWTDRTERARDARWLG